MRFFRYSLKIVSLLFVFMLLSGCGSQLQKADKMAVSDPKSAIPIYEQIMKSKPGSDDAKQAHLKIAETYYERMDDQEKGLKTYEEVANAYPKSKYSGESYWAIAMHYFQAKDYDKARQNFAKVTEEIPGTEMANDAALAIAKSYEELKKYEEAANMYLEFSKTHPQHRRAAQAGLDAAKMYETNIDDPDKAIEAYKFVASQYAISSSGREAKEALTNMGVDLSEVPPATAEAGSVQVAPNESTEESDPGQMANIGVTRRRRASNVARSSDLTTRASAAAAAQEQPASRTVSKDFGVDVMNLMPNISVDQQGTMYDAMYMIGITYLQSGQYKESGALFEKSIELSGSKPWNNAAKAYYFLGKSYKGIGNNEKSEAMLKEAIKRDPKVIDEMIRSGETQYGEQDYEQALDSYKTALGLVPYRDSEIYYKMGLVYQKLKDPDKELDSFERSVALKPNDADAIQHLAEVLYYRKNDPVRAALYDSEAKGQGANDYKVQKELGDLSYKYNSYSWARTKYGNGSRVLGKKISDDLKKAIGDKANQITEDPTKIDIKMVSASAASGNQTAIEAIEKVAPLMDDYRFINARIALALTKNKQYKEAQDQLDKLLAEDPNAANSAEYQYAVGLLALSQGNTEAGIAAVKKAIEINPNHEEAANKLKELGI